MSAGRSLEFPPDPGDGGDVLVVEWVDEVLPDGVLEGPADLGSVTTPASVKLMSEIRPSAWSAPRCGYPASMRSCTSRDARVGLTLTSWLASTRTGWGSRSFSRHRISAVETTRDALKRLSDLLGGHEEIDRPPQPAA